jgi:hypothetical protein
MSDARQLWNQLLGLPEPWTTLKVDIHPSVKKVDVHVGLEEPRGWFGFGRKPARATESQTWRHLNYGKWQVQVSVAAPVGADLSRHAWAGERDFPVTRAMSQQIFDLLRSGCSLQVVSDLLGLPLGDVWRFKYFLDNGRWSTGAESEPAAPGAAAADQVVAEGLPVANDPVWLDILEGRRQLDVRVLGLKMLLTKLRGQLGLISDRDVRMHKVEEFQRYFAKNRKLLAHEIDQLREAA